ncbi:MAG: nitrilase-related carbon-nitrogen hydrolase [Pseudomonadota bacterium]
MNALRIACVQWRLDRVASFDEWAGRFEDCVRIAAGYGARFVVFPEYVTAEILSAQSGSPDGPASIAGSTALTPAIGALYRRCATRHRIHVIGGSHLNRAADGRVRNTCLVALADGSLHARDKIHCTPNEREAWGVEGGVAAPVLEADGVTFAIAICYDSEFPELGPHHHAQRAQILFVPFITDDRAGYLRVRYSCAARAVENQLYVALAGSVGIARNVHNLDACYARSAVLTPSDHGFARDGIAVEAEPGVEAVVVADVDLRALDHARRSGTVRNLDDRRLDLYASVWKGSA